MPHLVFNGNKYFIVTIALLMLMIVSTVESMQLSDSAVNQSKVRVSLGSTSLDHVDLDFEFENLNPQRIDLNGQQYYQFEVENENSTGPEGYPDLPSIVRFILMPPQSGVSVRISNIESHITAKELPPLPRIDRYRDDFTGDNASFLGSDVGNQPVWNEDYLKYQGFWPPDIIELKEPAIMRGYRILPVIINPVRWNPQTGETEVIDDLDFQLDFTADENRLNIVENPDRIKPSQSVYKIVRNLVMNPPAPQRDMGVSNGAIMYVIGDWNDIEETLQPLVEWRRRMGWTVEVVRVATNSTAAIKNAIQDAYDDWDTPPENVVICGDTDGNYARTFYDMRRGANHPYESDHLYTLLDGNDILPDVAIGRLIFESRQMLENIVEKTIQYESDPYLGANNNQRGWQKRAAVVAGDYRSGTSSIDLCRWSKNLFERYGFTDVDELYWTPQNQQPNANQFIRNNFEAGISVYLYRGWTFMSGFDHEETDNLRNGRMLPFVMLATCNTGDYGEHVSSQYYYTERFLYSSRGGAIGAVGAAGATHTAYNNLIAASTFKSIFSDGIPYQGWAFMRGKAELWSHYGLYDDIPHEENNGMDGWECETYIFNLMGDPAVDLFTDVPRELDVEYPNVFRTGESHVEVFAMYEDDGEPAAGARICLYKPGEFQEVRYADEDGVVVFDLDPELMEEGSVQLTVTGHNLRSCLDEIEISDAEYFLAAGSFEIDDDNDGESRGDGDGDASPTEILELTLAITNYGSRTPEGEVEIRLTSDYENLIIIEGEAVLDEAPAPGQSENVTFVVEIGGGYPAELEAIFRLEVSADNENWISSLTLPLEGPVFEFVSFSWAGNDELTPAGVAECQIRIKNIGDKGSDALNGELFSLTPTVDVPEPEGNWEDIGRGSSRRSEGYFRLAANLFHIGGAPANLALILSSEAGFIDTVFISFAVDEPHDGQPFGPDDYGYICLDDTDDAWFSAPVYNWIEIDPNRHGNGRDTELSDTREEADASTLIDLPFDFQYYGEVFDEITICTNGWLAMGDCHELITARNRRIPSGMVAPGMICPFWEDLLTTNDGGIFTLYDDEAHIFVIEWSRMRKLGPQGNNEPYETFEVILYDPAHHPTLTGDGDIVFQYEDVTDNRSCFQAWDTPFATVGMGSPDQSDGLTYTYWGDLSAGAADLEDDRAIKFTTAVLTSVGTISGHITDHATDEPVTDATVYTLHGFVAQTDENGFYEIDNAPAEVEFSITARKRGYNDATLDELILEDEGHLDIDFELLHPEFSLSRNALDGRAAEGEQIEIDFMLTNDGNGPLVWRAEKRNPGDADADPWELRSSLNVGEILGDDRIAGVVFVEDHYYVSGSNNGDPVIYILNREGELINSFPQFTDSRYGMIDLAWDGQLIWGAEVDILYGFTREGELVSTLASPYNPTKNLAWDPDNQWLWVSSITSDIQAIDLEGNAIRTLSHKELRIYGLAYWEADPDGYNLYTFDRTRDGVEVVHKMNTANSDTLGVIVPEPLGENDRPTGAFITPALDLYSWVFMAVVNNGNTDRIDIYQLDIRSDWMQLEPSEGILNAEEFETLTLTLDASTMPIAELEGQIIFNYNAMGEQTIVPVSFTILDGAVREIEISLISGWNMISINVDPPAEMYSDDELRGPNVILMTEQLRIDEDNSHLLMLKDQFGNFYNPAFGFCNIPYWNLTEGYLISVDEDLFVSWTGAPIPADTDIPLLDGWNMVAYFPEYELDASGPDFYVLRGIRDHLLLAKDEAGRFILPDFDFSNMLPWTKGEGYLLKVDQADLVLNYPPQQENDRIAVYSDHRAQPKSLISRTTENMSVLINSFELSRNNDRSQVVAVNSNGIIIGEGNIHDGRCGLAVWGDDPATPETEGLTEGENFQLMLSGAGRIFVSRVLSGDGLIYKKDAFTVLEVSDRSSLPDDYYLSEAYPNPFNSTVKLEYGLPEASRLKISVFDLSGRLVENIKDFESKAGRYTAVWNAGGNSSGIYWIRMEAGAFQQVRKVTLMK